MGILVHEGAIHCAKIFRPLVFNVDQRPTPTAEFEVLETGELEEILLRIDHPIRVQVTPAGRCSSSTVTV